MVRWDDNVQPGALDIPGVETQRNFRQNARLCENCLRWLEYDFRKAGAPLVRELGIWDTWFGPADEEIK